MTRQSTARTRCGEPQGGKSYYEASVPKDGKNYMLHVSDDGKVLKREDAKDEKK